MIIGLSKKRKQYLSLISARAAKNHKYRKLIRNMNKKRGFWKNNDRKIVMSWSWDLQVTGLTWPNHVTLTSSSLPTKPTIQLTYSVWSYKVIPYISVLWCQGLLVICLQSGSWRWLLMETKTAFSTSKAIIMRRN